MKKYYAAEVLGEGKNGQPKYVGRSGKLVTTPHFFASHTLLKRYLDCAYTYRTAKYNRNIMHDRTRLYELEKPDVLEGSKLFLIDEREFHAAAPAKKAASYSAYATFRLRKTNGTWVSTASSGGKFGKTWTTAGALRRHIGDRIRWLQSTYEGATVHVTIYDNDGIRVLETRAIPVLDFFLQSPIYAKRWAEINTPTTISDGYLSGRLAHSDIV